MDELQLELAKLTELAPTPLDLSFLLGYLACALPQQLAGGVKPILRQLMDYLRDSLITPINALQLLAVLKFKVLPKKPESIGRLVGEIQAMAGELICDNNFLDYRYFSQRIVKDKEIEKQGLGIDCTICTVEIDAVEVCCLSCSHMYHRNCLQSFCRERIASKMFPLLCPTEECGVELLIEEVNEYLSRELRDKYDEFVFHNYVQKHMEDTSWCPTPGCQAVFAFDAALDNYKCPSCNKHYCLACKCQMHSGMNCKQYKKLMKLDEPDRKFMMLVKGAKFKQCPNCKFWVQKNEGCDHMTCRCKYQFCYVCGGKYGACRCNGQGEPEVESDQERIPGEQQIIRIDVPRRPLIGYSAARMRSRSFSPVQREHVVEAPLQVPLHSQIRDLPSVDLPLLPPPPPPINYQVPRISPPPSPPPLPLISLPSPSVPLPPSSPSLAQNYRHSPFRLPYHKQPNEQMEFVPGIRPLPTVQKQNFFEEEKKEIAPIFPPPVEQKKRWEDKIDRFKMGLDLKVKYLDKKEELKPEVKVEEPPLLVKRQIKVERKFPTVEQIKQKYKFSFNMGRDKKEEEK